MRKLSNSTYRFFRWIIKTPPPSKYSSEIQDFYGKHGIPVPNCILKTKKLAVYNLIPGNSFAKIDSQEERRSLSIELIRLLRSMHASALPIGIADKSVSLPYFVRSILPPTIVSHCDITPNNVIVNKGHISGIIDWEMAGPIHPYTELAKVCWHFTRGCNKRKESIEDCCKEYGLLGDGFHLVWQTIITLIEQEICFICSQGAYQKAVRWRKEELVWFEENKPYYTKEVVPTGNGNASEKNMLSVSR